MKIEDKRQIINSIMEQEIQENDLNISSFSFGRLGYYNSYYFWNKLKANKLYNPAQILTLSALPFLNGVSRKKSKEIVVFYNDIPTPFFEDSIVRLLKTTYHELYHALDDARENDYSFDMFANTCDRFIVSHSPIDSIKYFLTSKGHDSFMFEILANNYGIKRAEEYIEKNNISINNYEKNKLQKLKQKYELQYQNYDLTKRLDMIINDYKVCLNCKDFDNKIFSLFLNDDSSVKNLNKVFIDENVLSLDTRILKSFLKSKKIKESLNNIKLSEEALLNIEKILDNNKSEEINDNNRKTI
ncbi:MAG: hypothetical protein Q4E75_02050 [bacterium]|nr:hypothetical protein [bacterium]